MASLTVEGSTWQGASRCACMGVCVYGCPHILSDLHFLSFHGNFPRIKSVLKKSSRGEGEGCKAEPTSNCETRNPLRSLCCVQGLPYRRTGSAEYSVHLSACIQTVCMQEPAGVRRGSSGSLETGVTDGWKLSYGH